MSVEILFEDEHLLVVNKPPGWNTHAAEPWLPDGIYEALKESRESLSIHQRLDKETSGVMLFGKSRVANQGLSELFLNRKIAKEYLFLTRSRAISNRVEFTSAIVRHGDKYAAKAPAAGEPVAATVFEPLKTMGENHWIRATPLSGKTHQIRVHAQALGAPILGDSLYGGPRWPRLCLHSASLKLQHPATGQDMSFSAEPDFVTSQFIQLRRGLLPEDCTALRMIHSEADGFPGIFVDKLGDYALLQGAKPPSETALQSLESELKQTGIQSLYFKQLSRTPGCSDASELMPQRLLGPEAPPRFQILENGLRFGLSFEEGYSVGVFLDQRDNRRRLLTGKISPGWALPKGLKVLNTFAYTCAFSCASARAGHQVTSLDLSPKYLDWGRENFALNEVAAEDHDFIYGDTFSWLKRFHNKARLFDVIILDPPTFSRSRESGVFKAEKDYPRLVSEALKILAPGGTLLASANSAGIRPEKFLDFARSGASAAKRGIVREQYYTQPPDFPASPATPPHLKTVWLQFD